eukprot:scaffold1505_cov256-Pinguiococcus_pyrenoidosus.AAC.24
MPLTKTVCRRSALQTSAQRQSLPWLEAPGDGAAGLALRLGRCGAAANVRAHHLQHPGHAALPGASRADDPFGASLRSANVSRPQGLQHARCRITPHPVVMPEACRSVLEPCWQEYLDFLVAVENGTQRRNYDRPDVICLTKEGSDEPEDNFNVRWTKESSPWHEKNFDCVWPEDTVSLLRKALESRETPHLGALGSSYRRTSESAISPRTACKESTSAPRSAGAAATLTAKATRASSTWTSRTASAA